MRPIPLNQEIHFPDNTIIVSKTDTQGKITYGNEIFIKMSGYDEHELLGKPHNIIRHPDMPSLIFKHLWKELKEAREVHAYVKNLCKDGSFYWVKANITPSFDTNGKIIAYYSVRRKPSATAINEIQKLYKELKSQEMIGGVANSEKHLTEILSRKGVCYEEYILSL